MISDALVVEHQLHRVIIKVEYAFHLSGEIAALRRPGQLMLYEPCNADRVRKVETSALDQRLRRPFDDLERGIGLTLVVGVAA